MVCFLLVRPEPRHRAQGVIIIDFLPPQRRQELRSLYEPVLISSCRGRHSQIKPSSLMRSNGFLWYKEKILWTFLSMAPPHHASAVAIVAHRYPGARLATASVTSRAGVLDVYAQVFVGTLNRLQKGDLHQEL